MVRKQKEQDRRATVQKIRVQGGPSCKLFWSDLKANKGGNGQKLRTVRARDGRVLDTEEEVRERVAEYWETLGALSTREEENSIEDFEMHGGTRRG